MSCLDRIEFILFPETRRKVGNNRFLHSTCKGYHKVAAIEKDTQSDFKKKQCLSSSGLFAPWGITRLRFYVKAQDGSYQLRFALLLFPVSLSGVVSSR
ncbi:Uncharacterized protein HZ326_23496 [Fusarium oxysporum f. sp. albedinis]|nr:Uncharacterized protein HZ326_23496 [Fusarium oxysporum f. sp. albedinis]